MLSVLLLMSILLADVSSHSSEVDELSDEDAPQQEASEEALQRLFEKYGGRDSATMSFEGFEHLLESLGLGHIVIADHDVHDHQTNDGRFKSRLHENHVHKVPPEHSDHNENDDEDDTSHHTNKSHHEHRHQRSVDDATARKIKVNSSTISQCLSAIEILHVFHKLDGPYYISRFDFIHMCPTIIYQLDAHLCHTQRHASCHAESVNQREHCLRYHDGLDRDHRPEPHGPHLSSLTLDDPKVWGSATLAVTLISLVGLAAVALIPAMSHRNFYDHLLHFLVAVAIATLTGDALLHLLPHALLPHGQHGLRNASVDHHHDEDEDDAADHASQSVEMVYKGLVVLLGIYVFFITERLISVCRTVDRHHNQNVEIVLNEVGQRLSSHDSKRRSAIYKPTNNSDRHTYCTDDVDEDADDCLAAVAIVEDGLASHHHDDHHHHDYDLHHDPHHHHGHSHGPPSSVASAAWMVIMGDGLHNFTDGLAIGAAFASSFAGGIGTTTAVFCHELPHELGDFAVLLNCGMTVKQAIMYNMVSSVLAFTGMFCGVVLGTVHWSASSWIFALTAGIFLYVSLVDMLPQITRDAVGTRRAKCWSLFLDVIGLTLGVIIMILIAFYEDNIQLIFADG